MIDAPELLPCPFCAGAIDVVTTRSGQSIKTARHPANGCLLSGHSWWFVPRFIEPWNTRILAALEQQEGAKG